MPTSPDGLDHSRYNNSRMFRLNSCCCCFSLKAGTIFTGICGIILSILSLIIIFTVDVEWRTIIIEILDKNTVRIIFAINLVMTILISTLLIIGTLKRNTFMMLPWVALGLMLVIALLVSVLYTSISTFLKKDVANHVLYGVLWLIFGLLSVVIYGYLWFVVFSHFQQLRMEKVSTRIGPYGRPYSYQRP